MNEGLGSIRALKRGKIDLNAIAGLVGLRKNRYIRGNLWFSYDRVLRVGPPGTRSFLLPEGAQPQKGRQGAFQGTGLIAA